MPRKRLVAPEFFIHEELCGLSPVARLAFIGLWTQADRRGIFRWRPNPLKLAILPYESVDFAAILDDLTAGGFIVRYEDAGEGYGIIPKFKRWQTFHKDEKASDAPAPCEHGVSTVPAPCEHGANMPIAVAVALTVPITDAVAVGGRMSPRAPNGAGAPPPARRLKCGRCSNWSDDSGFCHPCQAPA